MRRPSQSELEESLRTDGCLHPILRFGGQVFDGSRRLQACTLFGLQPMIRDCDSFAQLLRLLWLCEPERAIVEAGKMKIAEYAETFATTQIAVAAVLRSTRSDPRSKLIATRRKPANPIDVRDQRARKMQIWISHRLRYLIGLAAWHTGRSAAEYVRQAAQTAISADIDANTIRSLERGRLIDRSDREKKKAKP